MGGVDCVAAVAAIDPAHPCLVAQLPGLAQSGPSGAQGPHPRQHWDRNLAHFAGGKKPLCCYKTQPSQALTAPLFLLLFTHTPFVDNHPDFQSISFVTRTPDKPEPRVIP